MTLLGTITLKDGDVASVRVSSIIIDGLHSVDVVHKGTLTTWHYSELEEESVNGGWHAVAYAMIRVYEERLALGHGRSDRDLLSQVKDNLDGLLAYEDECIRDFVERRDPAPRVLTGPRKWIARLRQTRKEIEQHLMRKEA